MRTKAPAARLSGASFVTHTANGNQSSGATPANTSAVALTPPMARMTSANSAGSRHPPRRMARIVNASIHGRPANGRRMTDSRAASVSVYGVSAYANDATAAGIVPKRSVRRRNHTPAPARNRIEPSHNRCANHIGTPVTSASQ